MTEVDRQQERWRLIEQIFLQAIDLPRHQRDAFLLTACGADNDLRHEIVTLLMRDEMAAEGAESTVIAGIVGEAAASLFADDQPPDTMAGSIIGNYRLIREIGRGGMGAVYLAVRADLAFEKQVAIKLVKRGIDTDLVLRRFWYERRILAGLDHPYIARLLDGGTTPDGLPYFVMEYVDGKPVDVYSCQAGLSIRQRCELFRKICEAVSYAHRNLVIHRDLKPANILITADGLPKLLDFGIARLLTADPGENTILGTPANRALTPEFASPEQTVGDAVTTATDVYSLGVTLRAILTAGSPTASTTAPKTGVAHGLDALPSDLQIILRKASRSEPEQRYASVADFSEDLRRYLLGLPIQARDQTLAYQALRFVNRNRAGVAAAMLVCLLILAGIAAVIWESRKAARERRAAEQRLGQAVEMANRTLADVNGTMAQLPGTTAARREIVRNTEQYLDQLARDSGNDSRVLAALGTAYIRVAEVQGNPDFANLGDAAGSLATYHKALRVIDPLLKDDPANRNLQELAADAHQGLGSVLTAVGSSKQAVAEYHAAIELSNQLLAANPNDTAARVRVLHATLLNFLHFAPEDSTSEIEAKYLPEAIKLAAENPRNVEIQLDLAGYYTALANLSRNRGAMQESLSFHRKCIALREKVARQVPRNSAVLRDLAIGYGQAGDVLGSPFIGSLGDFDGALKFYRKEAAIVDEMSRSDPSDKRAHYDLGIAWMRIGIALQAKGDLSASNQALARSMAEFGVLHGGGPEQAPYQRALELVYEYSGRNSWRSGDRRGAIAWYRKSLALANEQLQRDRDDGLAKRQVVAAEGPIAVLSALEGDTAGAHHLIDQTIRDAEPMSSLWKGRAWNWRGQIYQAEKDYRAAVESFDKAIAIWSADPALLKPPHYVLELRDAQARVAECRRRAAKPIP